LEPVKAVFAVAAGYLLGSLSFGGLIGLAHGTDPRRWGSGRLGALNTARSLGPWAGLAVFIGDTAKGAAAVWLPRLMGLDPAVSMAAGLAAVAGHAFPLYFGFRGGKGLACSLGVLAALDYHLLPYPLAVAGAILLITRNMYWAALSGILCFLFYLFLADAGGAKIVFGILLSALLIFTHRRNIHDLILGTEGGRDQEGR
jgi:glycerol-3-phosphate acyltransferase PlsY